MTTQTRAAIVSMLQGGICNLNYRTVNGETRTTRGTLASREIPEDMRGNGPLDGTARFGEGSSGTTQQSQIAYYDVEQRSWKSFLIDNMTSPCSAI